MAEDFNKAKLAIEQSRNILFTTHQRTDGDDLGSVLALAHYCRAQGKQITIAITGEVPGQLRYLPMSETVVEIAPKSSYDLVVISGCSTLDRIHNESVQAVTAPRLNIDHHPDNSNFGDINLVNAKKSAVAELTYDLFKFAGWNIDHNIALCLLTGIVTDTGIFKHSNTTADTLNAAAELMSKGARVTTVTKHNYEGKDLTSLKAWAKALQNAQYDPKQKMIISILTQEELAELGNPAAEAFDGVVETLNKVPEARFAMFLKQDAENIKGSLRSEERKGVDVQKIAKMFGGGGHKLASGFSLVGKLARDEQGKWAII